MFPVLVATDQRYILQTVLICASSLLKYPNHFHIIDVVLPFLQQFPQLWRITLVMDFMIRFRESVRVVQFAKKSRSFVRSFSRVSGSGESFSESFRLTSSLRPSFSFTNRECQPSRSDSLPPSAPRSHSRIANATRVVQTHFLPPSLVLVRES